MSQLSKSTRVTLFIASLGFVATALSTPVIAAEGKGKTITMPASALQDPAAKLCMPREMIDTSKHSTLPKTVCQTRDEWAAQGINIVSKK